MNQKAKIDFLIKYAEYAESLLAKKYDSYTSTDVEKLAAALIEKDQEAAAEFDYVADLVKTSQYVTRGFAKELNERLGQEKFSKLAGAMSQLLKGIEKVKSAAKTVDKTVTSFGGRVAKALKRDPKNAKAYGYGTIGAGTLAVGGAVKAMKD